MKITDCLNLFRRGGRQTETGGFSDFFRRAPIREKKAVFRKAAEKANEDQRRLFKQAQSKI